MTNSKYIEDSFNEIGDLQAALEKAVRCQLEAEQEYKLTREEELNRAKLVAIESARLEVEKVFGSKLLSELNYSVKVGTCSTQRQDVIFTFRYRNHGIGMTVVTLLGSTRYWFDEYGLDSVYEAYQELLDRLFEIEKAYIRGDANSKF